MKKSTILVLAFALLFGFAACSKRNYTPSSNSRSTAPQNVPAQSVAPMQSAAATDTPNSEADFSVGLTVDSKGVVITEYKGKATSVRIPATIQGLPVKEIGKRAFYGSSGSLNEKITSVTIPEGVTKIGEEAFWGCESLRAVSLPDTLISIGERAFNSCWALDSINLPAGLKEIGGLAFRTTGLTSISWPTGLTTIPSSAFSNTKLRNVTIPEGVTKIGETAFEDCENLASVTLPSTIRILGCRAFADCSSLTTIKIPETVKKIEFDFSYVGGDGAKNAFEGSHKLSLESQAALRRVGYTGSF